MIALARRCDFPWTVAACALAVAATAAAFASDRVAGALIADARIAHGQVWRALTGPLVHATWGHLARDAALVAIAGAGYEAPLRSRRTLVFALGLVLPALAALAAGGVRWYCGLSGLSHALLAAALSYEVVSRRGRARAIALGLAAIAAVKPLYELVTGTPAFAMSLGNGVVQMPVAHATGVCVGIACGLRAALDRRRAAPERAPVVPARPRHRAPDTYPT